MEMNFELGTIHYFIDNHSTLMSMRRSYNSIYLFNGWVDKEYRVNVPMWKSDMNKCIGGRYVIVLYQRRV